MGKNQKALTPEPNLQHPKKAGDVEPFPSGRVTYLAPLPLPTQSPTHCPYVGELNDVYLDFGLGSPKVFSWQYTFGIPFNAFILFTIFIPLGCGLIGLMVGYSAHQAPGVRIVVASPNFPEKAYRGRKETGRAVLFI